MSLISDRQVDAVLKRARNVGMAQLELRRWQQILEPAGLDTCGCEASAKAAVAVLAIGGFAALLFAGKTRRDRVVFSVAGAAVVAALAGKLLGQRAAEERRDHLLATLVGRVDELESGAAGPVN